MKLMIRRIAVFGVTMMMAANLMIAFAQGTESESLGDSDMMPLQTQISYEIDALEDNVSVSGEKTGYSPTPVATNQEIVPEDRGSASIFGVDGNTGASGSGADSGSVPADSVDSSSSGAGGSTGASGGGADSAFIPTDGADSSSSGVDGNTGASGSGADSGSVPADSVDSSSSGEGGSTGASGSNPKDPVPESEKQDDKSLLKPNMNEVQPDNNEKQRSGWVEESGQKYYYDGNGEMQKGLQPIGGYWYYLDEETGALWTSGWKQAPKGWLWSDSAGKIPLGFKYLDGYWRYFSTDTGYMQIGFFNTHTGGCSYADADGKITPGWQKINEKFYFLDLNNLVLLRGWVDFNNNRFYYKDDYTGATGAYQIDGKWYYFENEWGALVRNTTVTIGGIQYRVDENGIIQNYQVGEVYGIDVSSHQGVIDWRKVADSGVSFAMIRALTWSNAVNYYVIDPYFEANVRNAKANGIDVGVYLYSYAFSQAEMAEEINFFLNSSELSRLRTDGILFDYPVYIDYEDPLVISNVATKQQRTDIVRYGMILLDQAGYLPGFYTYHSFATNLLDGQQLVEEGYEFWVAHTSATSNPWGASAGIWQYSHNGTVPGIQGNVDLNYAYKNYPSIVNPGGGTIPSPVEDTLSVYDEVSGETVTDSVENILAAIVQNEVGGIPLTGLDAEQLFKAQAVAAHSWILYSQGNGEAYPSVKLAPAGSISQAVKNAVSGVKAYIVAYNGTAACTVYGSASAPQTNSAQDMGWSAQPYLINVSSPYENAFGAAWQDKTNTISLSRMKNNIENKLGISTSGYDPSSWLTNPVYDPQTGYCLRITVCGTVVQGGRFYENCYGLYSPNFMFTYSGSAQSWSFVTRGNGHCVGMSQYGAAGFAQAGYSWQQLLLHYYPGTVLQTL